MASPESKLAIDESVPIPASVKAAADAAAAAHAAAYPQPQPDPPAPGNSLQADPPAPAQDQTPPEPVQADPPAPAREQRQVPESGEPGSWEHRYFAMKGRFDQQSSTIGQMQQQMAELGDELARTTNLLQLNPAERADATSGRDKRPGQAPRKMVRDEDVQTYGPELIDFVQRAARDAVGPELGETRQEVRQVSQRVQATTQQGAIGELEAAVPNWRAVNLDPRFKLWCSSPDVYSGQVRGKLLNAAFRAADAPRVIAFFKGFLAEEQATGQLPDPQQGQQQGQPAPRQAAVNLETLTAPGRPKPAGGQGSASAADKPVFTRAQISSFYSMQGRASYVGRDADRKRDEEAIFAAQREGRVRG